jgi:hypothetical protein
MEGDDGEGDYIAVSVPTELVKRLINAISGVMQEWEKEHKGGFTALVGNAAMHIATEFIDASMERVQGETMQ